MRRPPILGVSRWRDQTGPWMLLLLTFALGLGSTMNGPAWQAIMPELVPQSSFRQRSRSIRWASISRVRRARLWVAWWWRPLQPGIAFMLNAVSFVGVMIVLYLWPRKAESPPASGLAPERVGSAIIAGLRYVRFAPPLHPVLIRSGTFIISASALWSILPLVAKVELHSESTGYGVLLGCLGAGSIAAAMVLTRVRHLAEPEVLVTAGIALFGLANVAMAYLERFGLFGVALLLAGMAWMTVNSNLNTVAQQALPAWVRARGLGVYLLVFQGAMALGSVIWGEVASRFGLRTTLFIAGVALLAGAGATARLRFQRAREGDTRPSMHWPEPQYAVEPDPEHGPVLVTVEYRIRPDDAAEFVRAMKPLERIRRRDGAIQWGLFEDAASLGRYIESFLVESWAEHLRQHERATVADRSVEQAVRAFHQDDGLPTVTHWIAARE